MLAEKLPILYMQKNLFKIYQDTGAMYKKIAIFEAFYLTTFDFVYRRGVLRVLSNICSGKLHHRSLTGSLIRLCIVGNKAKGRISKRVLQENKAHQDNQ